uniref:Uncharacterized protein n=1 Tax=Oncorhynchus kisutch TaxID=8019 RepID=A0A8C7GNG9_ONCKI
ARISPRYLCAFKLQSIKLYFCCGFSKCCFVKGKKIPQSQLTAVDEHLSIQCPYESTPHNSLSIFEVCFEGVAEAFGVFDKLLLLVLKSLDTQRRDRQM